MAKAKKIPTKVEWDIDIKGPTGDEVLATIPAEQMEEFMVMLGIKTRSDNAITAAANLIIEDAVFCAKKIIAKDKAKPKKKTKAKPKKKTKAKPKKKTKAKPKKKTKKAK